MQYDIERLRNDMRDDGFGMAFGAGLDFMIYGALELDSMSDSEILRVAKQNGINIERYRID